MSHIFIKLIGDFMKLCNKDCIPCCDFCIHAIHERFEHNGKMITGGPIGCSLHLDKEHQDIAIGCYYCEDYHCFRAKD